MRILWLLFDMLFKKRSESLTFVVEGASRKYLSRFVLEECKNVQGAVSVVFKLLQPSHFLISGHAGSNSLQDLNARTFVEEEEMFRRVRVQLKQVLHLGEEIWVGDMQEVFDPMGFEMVLL